MILSLGSNGNGQLGIGHLEDTDSPVEVSLPPGFDRLSVRQIATGGNHTIVLYENGQVLACGSNLEGQCALHERRQITQLVPITPLDQLGKIRAVAAGWAFSLFLAEDGSLYAAGACDKGSVGDPESGETAGPESIRKLNVPPTAKIAASVDHWVAVGSKGAIWGAGNGRKGQLGPIVDHNLPGPRPLFDGVVVQDICCAREATILLAKAGNESEILVWGGAKHGLGRLTERCTGRASEITSGWSHAYVLCDDGRCYSAGRDDRGQGVSPELPKLKGVSAGSEHCLAISESGECLAWGWNEHGNCGRNGGEDVAKYTRIMVPGTVTLVQGGCGTSWIVTK